jgi:hypothetical protein
LFADGAQASFKLWQRRDVYRIFASRRLNICGRSGHGATSFKIFIIKGLFPRFNSLEPPAIVDRVEVVEGISTAQRRNVSRSHHVGWSLMPKKSYSSSDEVEHLLLNAQLRDDLEPFLDESLDLLNIRQLPTPLENEFLASMLAWERAPVLPIASWFQPELTLPPPEGLDDERLSQLLQETIHKLYTERIVLDFTDHLSDRGLYCLLYRDILPSPEKKIDLPKNYLHWHCLDASVDPDTWLRFYATDEERRIWADENGLPLPAAERPPHPRKMPRRPL